MRALCRTASCGTTEMNQVIMPPDVWAAFISLRQMLVATRFCNQAWVLKKSRRLAAEI